jgi:hypothetical protein
LAPPFYLYTVHYTVCSHKVFESLAAGQVGREGEGHSVVRNLPAVGRGRRSSTRMVEHQLIYTAVSPLMLS